MANNLKGAARKAAYAKGAAARADRAARRWARPAIADGQRLAVDAPSIADVLLSTLREAKANKAALDRIRKILAVAP